MDTQTWSAELEDIFVNQRPRLCCVAARVLGNADQADDQEYWAMLIKPMMLCRMPI
ncbi:MULTISPECIES: hypothetical protein [unclassified Halomonas]|uniref:hypothetical protein n=1 Tax=unclassified Halomonas TaxID=2609666 RepID=UPI004033AB58